MQNSSKQYLQQYCKDADTNAFSKFYRAESPRLWPFLKNKGCNDDAYALLTEAFLKFIQVVCRGLRVPVALHYNQQKSVIENEQVISDDKINERQSIENHIELKKQKNTGDERAYKDDGSRIIYQRESF